MNFFKTYRKFCIMLLVLLSSIVLLCNGLLESADFASILSAVGVAFMGSNAVEHAVSAVKTWVGKEKDQGD